MPTVKEQLFNAIKELSLYNISSDIDRLTNNTDTVIEQNRVLESQNRHIILMMVNLANSLSKQQENQMSEVKDLIEKLGTELTDLKSVREGFEKVISTFKANAQNALDDNDVAKLRELVDGFDTSTKALSDAVVANTPAASEPVVSTPVEPVVVEPTPAPVETPVETSPAASPNNTDPNAPTS